jgi:glucokinase
MPGPFDYENGISLMLHGKFLDILKMNIKEELAKRLSVSTDQIHFVNDAVASMEGEVFGGCVQGLKKIFGVTKWIGNYFGDGELATDEDLWDSL